jgi:hypothetical protein
MDTSAGATPAWKRLGLKLRNDNQSRDPLPDLNANGNTNPPAEAHNEKQGGGKDADFVADPTESGKSSSLGKRKHQYEAAEQDVQTVKKSRSIEQEKASVAFGGVVLAAPKETNGESTPRPRGDPNYRQKKKKGRRTSAYGQEQRLHAQRSSSRPEAPVPSPAELQEADDGTNLLPSTESYTHAPPPVVTPKASRKALRNTSYDSSTPPRTDRRKSVTFTPDTKTVDGNSASNLFKKWVAEQKGAQGEFSSAEVAQFAPPPKVHPANGVSEPESQSAGLKQTAKDEKKPKKKKQRESTSAVVEDTPSHRSLESTPSNKNTATPKPKGKKKDPSLYIDYLTRYHNDYSNWKFNKAKQNDVVENALNVFRIPDKHSEALCAYIKGLKGIGVIERLKSKCKDTLKELDEEDQKDPNAMDDIESRKKAKEEALEERLAKEKKRRQTDADIEDLKDHPNPDGFVRRLKRRRAEALLTALNLAAPLPPPKANGVAPETTAVQPASKPNPRKRQSRTEVSSDESSSSSSESSSSEESSSEESSSESSSDDSSDSDSDSGSDSDGDTTSSDDKDGVKNNDNDSS